MITIEENLKKAIGNTTTCLSCGDYLTMPHDFNSYADPYDPSAPYMCTNKGCLNTTYFITPDPVIRVNKVYTIFCISLHKNLYLMTSSEQQEIFFERKENYSSIKVPLNNLDFSDIPKLIEKYKTYVTFV